MASSLSVTVRLTDDQHWEVLAHIVPGGTLPLAIFVYTNTGNTQLGQYFGVANLAEYQRLQTFSGTAIPVFANKFVKTTQAKIVLDINEDTNRVVTAIEESVKALSLELSAAAETTQIINIP